MDDLQVLDTSIEKRTGKIALLGYLVIYLFGAVLAMLAVEVFMRLYYAGELPEAYQESDLYMALNNLVVYVMLLGFTIFIYRKFLVSDTKKIFSNITEFFIFGGLVAASFVVAMMVNVSSSLVLELLGVSQSENQSALEPLVKNYAYIMLPVTIIGAPFVEELVFRKAIFDTIKNPIVAFVVSALSFGLIHVLMSLFTGNFTDMLNIIAYGGMGAVFAGLYLISKRNIMYPIALHMAQNTIACLAILFLM